MERSSEAVHTIALFWKSSRNAADQLKCTWQDMKIADADFLETLDYGY